MCFAPRCERVDELPASQTDRAVDLNCAGLKKAVGRCAARVALWRSVDEICGAKSVHTQRSVISTPCPRLAIAIELTWTRQPTASTKERLSVRDGAWAVFVGALTPA